MSLNIHTELNQTCYPLGGQPQTVYALLGLTPGAVAGRMPLDLRLVLDRSTSMNEDSGVKLTALGGGRRKGKAMKLDLLKAAIDRVIDLLEDGDRLTIVAFNEDHKVILAPTFLRGAAEREAARQAVHALKPCGSTRMADALAEAAAVAPLPDRVARMLVFTDGEITFCDVDEEQRRCMNTAAGCAGGMPWLVFGTGVTYNDRFLAGLAEASGGRHLHISNMDQATRMFQDEMAQMGDIVITNLVMNAQPLAGARLVRVSRVVPDIQQLALAGPDFVSADLGDVDRARGQKVLFELEVPPVAGAGARELARVRFSYHVPLRKLLNQTAEVVIEAAFTADAAQVQANQLVLNTVHLAGASQLYTLGVQAAAGGDVAAATRTLTTVAKIYTRLGQQDLGDQVRTLTSALAQQGGITGAAEDIRRTLSTVTKYTVDHNPHPPPSPTGSQGNV